MSDLIFVPAVASRAARSRGDSPLLGRRVDDGGDGHAARPRRREEDVGAVLDGASLVPERRSLGAPRGASLLVNPRSAGLFCPPSEPLESPGPANLAGVPPELVVAGVLGPGVCVPSSVSCLESVR